MAVQPVQRSGIDVRVDPAHQACGNRTILQQFAGPAKGLEARHVPPRHRRRALGVESDVEPGLDV